MSWREKYQNFLGSLFDLELRARYLLLTLKLTARIGLIALRWRLSPGYRNSFESNPYQKTPQTELTAPEDVLRPVRIYFYETDEVAADGPMAIVRFTGYNDHGEAVIVRQLSYDDTPDGFAELERDVAQAIQDDIDTIIYSDRQVSDFPLIHGYLVMDEDCDSISE